MPEARTRMADIDGRRAVKMDLLYLLTYVRHPLYTLILKNKLRTT